MPNEKRHEAEAYAQQVDVAKGRAKLASIALVLTLIARVYSVIVATWQSGMLDAVKSASPPSQEMLELSDRLTQYGGVTEILLLILTAVFFLRWFYIVVKLTRALGGETLTWAPSDAVWSFIIPFISFVRPYRVMRDVHDHLAPDLVPEPQAVLSADETTGYREMKVQQPPAPVKLTHASIGAWWASWWAANVSGNIAARSNATDVAGFLARNRLLTISDVLDIVSAVLAIMVVRTVTLRLLERFRRVRYNTAEQLAAANIMIQDENAKIR